MEPKVYSNITKENTNCHSMQMYGFQFFPSTDGMRLLYKLKDG